MLGRSATSNFKARKAVSWSCVKPATVQRAIAVATISSSCSWLSELMAPLGCVGFGLTTADGLLVVALVEFAFATALLFATVELLARAAGTLGSIHNGLSC